MKRYFLRSFCHAFQIDKNHKIIIIFKFISVSSSLLFFTGCFSGDNDHFLAVHQRKSGKPIFIYHHVQSIEKSLDTSDQKDYRLKSHLSSHAKISKLHPAIILKSTFSRPAYDPSLNLLAMTGEDQEVENLPVPATNVITVVSVFCWLFSSSLECILSSSALLWSVDWVEINLKRTTDRSLMQDADGMYDV